MFSSVPMLLLEEIPWIIILNQFLLMCYKHSKFFFLWSVNNEGHFTWTAKYVFNCISPSTRGNSLENYTDHFPSMRYKHCKFGCDQSIIKGTVLGKQRMFSSVSRLLLAEVPWIIILFTLFAHAVNTASLVSIGQLWRALYLEKKNTFSSPSQILLEEISWNCIVLIFCTCAINNVKFGGNRSIMMGTLFGKQSRFSSVYWLQLKEITWNLILFTNNK